MHTVWCGQIRPKDLWVKLPTPVWLPNAEECGKNHIWPWEIYSIRQFLLTLRPWTGKIGVANACWYIGPEDLVKSKLVVKACKKNIDCLATCPTLLIGQSHFTLDRIGGADANMSYDVIFNSVFYIEWDVHSHGRILYLVVKYNLDRDWTNYPQVCPLLKFAISW